MIGRQPIQITTRERKHRDGSISNYLVALCADGTIWRLIVGSDVGRTDRWEQIPGPPDA